MSDSHMGVVVTPPTWVKHRQIEAKVGQILDHEPLLCDDGCDAIVGCDCDDSLELDGFGAWASHLARVLFPHHTEGP